LYITEKPLNFRDFSFGGWAFMVRGIVFSPPKRIMVFGGGNLCESSTYFAEGI